MIRIENRHQQLQTNILRSEMDHKSPCGQCAMVLKVREASVEGQNNFQDHLLDTWHWFIISFTSRSIFNHIFSCNNLFLVFTRPWWLLCAMDMTLWWGEYGITMWLPTSASWLTVNLSLILPRNYNSVRLSLSGAWSAFAWSAFVFHWFLLIISMRCCNIFHLWLLV